MAFKKDERVMTPNGAGTIIRRESEVGVLSTRYYVRVDEPKDVRVIDGKTWENKPGSDCLRKMQNRQGFLAYGEKELSKPV